MKYGLQPPKFDTWGPAITVLGRNRSDDRSRPWCSEGEVIARSIPRTHRGSSIMFKGWRRRDDLVHLENEIFEKRPHGPIDRMLPEVGAAAPVAPGYAGSG